MNTPAPDHSPMIHHNPKQTTIGEPGRENNKTKIMLGYETEDQIDLRIDMEKVLATISKTSNPRVINVLRDYYGIRRFSPMVISEISKEVGVSVERIRQLRNRGLIDMFKILAAWGIQDGYCTAIEYHADRYKRLYG